MDENRVKRIKEIKENIRLRQIKEEIDNVKGVSYINAYKSDEVKEYIEKLSEIFKINFPVSFTKRDGYLYKEYIEYGYLCMGYTINRLRWLIPGYDGTSWCIEVEIDKDSLDDFIKICYKKKYHFDFNFFDLTNQFLMDIAYGDDIYEYRIIKY